MFKKERDNRKHERKRKEEEKKEKGRKLRKGKGKKKEREGKQKRKRTVIREGCIIYKWSTVRGSREMRGIQKNAGCVI